MEHISKLPCNPASDLWTAEVQEGCGSCLLRLKSFGFN